MTTNEWLQSATAKLARHDITSARLDSLIMLEHTLERDRAQLLAHPDDELPEQQRDKLNALLDARCRRIPLAYLIGTREFCGHRFLVSGAVLVPRPETEELVEYAIDAIPLNSRVLELGTGSGCISLSLASARTDVHITATDISEEALHVAERNRKQLQTNVEFVQSDLFTAINGRFDVILANLPYVPHGARRQPEITHEPAIALYGGDDGLDIYRNFFEAMSTYLSDSGWCLVEFSPTQFQAVRSMVSDLTVTPISEYIYRVEL